MRHFRICPEGLPGSYFHILDVVGSLLFCENFASCMEHSQSLEALEAVFLSRTLPQTLAARKVRIANLSTASML